MRRVWLGLGLMTLLVALIVPYGGQLSNAIAVAGHGDGRWMAAALGGLAAWQILQAAQFQRALQLAGLRPRLAELLPVVLANNCLNVIAPSASASSFALFAAAARRRGWPASPALTGVVVFALVEYAALGVFAAGGAGLLAARGTLPWVEGVAAGLAVGVGLGAGGLLAGAGRLGPAVVRWIEGGAGWLNGAGRRLLRREFLPPDRVARGLAALTEGWAAVARSSGAARGAALGLAGLGKLALLPVLDCAARAFGVALSLEALVIAASLGALFTVFSPTPQGIGVVEPALALALAGLGAAPDQALVVALAYRALTLWLPVAAGFICLQWWSRGWAAGLTR